MRPGEEAGIPIFLRGYKTSSFLWDLRGGEEGAGGNIKRCSFDTSSKPLFFHISVLAIKISSHQCRL